MLGRVLLAVVPGLVLCARPADAQLAPAGEEPAPGETPAREPVTISATAEIELVDVEGPGGFSNREPGLVKPRRRSPYVDLDKATLVLGASLAEHLRATIELRASSTGARIDRLFLDLLTMDCARWTLLVHAGRQKPLARPADRRVETYSPLGLAFWRGREWHLGAHLRGRQGPLAVDAMASVAMQRDLGDEPLGEDLGLPTIAFADGAPREGAAVEAGGLIGVSAHGAYAAGFGFRGSLFDNEGPDRLLDTFPDDYPALGETKDRTSLWYGGRAGYLGHGVQVLAEVIVQELGLLHRRGAEVGASYTIGFDVGGRRREIEPFLRYGQLVTTNLPERFLIPESWDRTQVVAALLLRPMPAIEVKLEYLFLEERTGLSAEGREGIDDDQLLVHLHLFWDVR